MAGTIDTTAQEPYEQCGYCHEYDGNSSMPSFPRLAGQKTAYIVKQLHDFRSGIRLGKMQATAELLSNDDIKTVANYFNKQTVINIKSTNLSIPQQQIAEKLFYTGDPARGLKSCVSCHGKSAMGSGTIPRLAGQHANYLKTQLILFKSGTRKNDEQGYMQTVSGLLTAAEIKAIVGFLERLKPRQHSPLSSSKILIKTNGYNVLFEPELKPKITLSTALTW